MTWFFIFGLVLISLISQSFLKCQISLPGRLEDGGEESFLQLRGYILEFVELDEESGHVGYTNHINHFLQPRDICLLIYVHIMHNVDSHD